MPRDITYFCKKENDIGKVIDLKGNSFKCEHCGDKLIYLDKERRLGGHGKTKDSVDHELRQVDEPLK